jgi:succinate dehydrogenase / fumarate reductase cytochrome b subunit
MSLKRVKRFERVIPSPPAADQVHNPQHMPSNIDDSARRDHTPSSEVGIEMTSSNSDDKRPLSPHLGIWRWHVTMATSIFHRASGVALYVGALILTAWLAALAGGEPSYGAFMGVLQNPLGLLVLFGITTAACYHLANGIRHLVWDAGKGFAPKTSNASGWATIVFGALGGVTVFALAFLV